MIRPTKQEWALGLAFAAAKRSEDLHNKVGAVVCKQDGTVAGIGYNGAPTGIEIDWTQREKRREFVIHAEINALRLARFGETANGFMAVTHCPCTNCILAAASHGIKTIVWSTELNWSNYDREAIERVALTCGIALKKIEQPE